MKQITTIGLDLAKQIFQVHGADADAFLSLTEGCVARRC